jgi:hypothetical protein
MARTAWSLHHAHRLLRRRGRADRRTAAEQPPACSAAVAATSIARRRARAAALSSRHGSAWRRVLGGLLLHGSADAACSRCAAFRARTGAWRSWRPHLRLLGRLSPSPTSGWLPLTGRLEARVLAHVAVITAVRPGLMLMSTMGMLRHTRGGRRAAAALLARRRWCSRPAGCWSRRRPWRSVPCAAFASAPPCWSIAARGRLRGDRAGWTAVAGIGLHAGGHRRPQLDRPEPHHAWPVHALSARPAWPTCA